jgi:predicted permease
MTELFSAIASVAFIIAIGFVAGRTLKLDRSTLSQITVYILAPALVIDKLYTTTLSAASMGKVLLGFSLLCCVLLLFVKAIAYYLPLTPSVAKSLMMTTLFPNNGNLGLSLINFSLGSAGLERAVIYMVASSIWLFGIAPALLQSGGIGAGIRLLLRIPLLWAIIVGGLLRLWPELLPPAIAHSLKLLGETTIPLALIILGLELSQTQWVASRYEGSATSFRLLLAPLLAWGIGTLLDLQGLDLQVFILQSAMPAAVNSVVLVAEFGGDAAKVARTIVTSTLVSFLTLPLVLWLTTR